MFNHFADIFGARWTTPLSEPEAYKAAFREWGSAIDALAPEQVARGVEATRASMDDWPPSIPRFLRMALGLPDPSTAASDAAHMKDDPIAKEIRRRAGGYAVRMASARDSQRMCEHAYRDFVEECIGRVTRGQPVAPLALIQEQWEERRRQALSPGHSTTTPSGPVSSTIPTHLQGD